MFKNVTGQTWTVLAFNRTTGARVPGDAANITAKISKDDAALVATDDVNPTETEDGKYRFTMLQAESDADKLEIYPESSTADVIVIGLPDVIYTRPPNFSSLGIEIDGDLTKVNALDVAERQAIQAELEEDGASLLDTLVDRLTATRAGNLDNIASGPVATQADVQAITQAQRVRIAVPQFLERPDSGNLDYRVWIYAYDEQHQAEDLDSNPTVTAENNTGVDRSSNLGIVTKQPATTGIYYVDYNVDSADAVEGLLLKVTATEGAVATEYAAATIVVDTTAVDFTAADRAKLDTLHDTRLTAGRASNLDNVDTAVSTRATPGDAMALTIAERQAIQAELEEDGASLLDTIRDVTDKLDTALELDGAEWRGTTNFFTNAPSGGGGGGGDATAANQTVIINHLTDIKGAGFDVATDSLENIRNRGDVAWITGAGGAPPSLLISTTIASLTSQSVFTLANGSDDPDAYEDAVVVITDQTNSLQKAVGVVATYDGATKTLTLESDPGVFTMAIGDNVDILAAKDSSVAGAPVLLDSIELQEGTGQNLFVSLKQESTGLFWNNNTQAFEAAPAMADRKIVINESVDPAFVGFYSGTPAASINLQSTGAITVYVHDEDDADDAAFDAVRIASNGVSVSVSVDENALAAAVTAGLGSSATATFVGPMLSAATLELVQGDDYKTTDGRQLTWTSNTWPDLTGAGVNLRIENTRDNNTPFGPVPGAVITPTGDAVVDVELVRAETLLLVSTGDQRYRFHLEATLTTGSNVTLARGFVDVIGDVA